MIFQLQKQRNGEIMYSVTVPMRGRSINASNREGFLKEIKRAKVERIYLNGNLYVNESLDLMRENVAYFKENGLTVGIWLCATVGHGSTLLSSKDDGTKPKFQRLVDLQGKDLYDTRCPYDKDFQKECGEKVAQYAKCKPDFIMLDDDFRLSQHGADFCCACDLHMAKICEYCGETVSREELKKLAFTGKPNKYREAWMKAQGESLKELAQAIRDGVDKVDPDMPLGVSSAYCSWDLDGADPIEITDILAGKNHKLLRLHGAPYWAYVGNQNLIGVCEIARMFASFLKDRPDIEIISEGDACPRPRFNMPSSYLEFFDAAMRADGKYDGILKYMMNYCGDPYYETSYIDRHCKRYDRLADLNRYFGDGANAGVRVLIKPHLIKDADLDLTGPREQSPFPYAGLVLGICGIPTIYDGEGICNAVFGESARHFDASYYKNGTVLDALSALILTEQGIDVGIDSFGGWLEGRFGTIKDNVTGVNETALKGAGKFLAGAYKKEIRNVVEICVGGKSIPLMYCYENEQGQRFMVFSFASDEMTLNPGFLRCYEVSCAVKRELSWLARKPLPAMTERELELYTLCRKGENDCSVALLNNFQDSILSPEIILDREYRHIECSGCVARIEGNKVIFETEIPAYDFASVRVYD